MKEKLQKIKLVVMDVDGTLTNGGMYYTKEGDVMKRFHVQDGMGITLLQRAGIDVAFLTSENSPIVKARAEKLKIKHVILGCRQKKESVMQLAKELKLDLSEIAYLGDDVNDHAPMHIVGISACPCDAVEVILQTVDLVLTKRGGTGVAREFAELLLAASGHPNTLPEKW